MPIQARPIAKSPPDSHYSLMNMDSPNCRVVEAAARTGRLARSRGFSLIELMVVMVIVGILVAIAIPQYKIYQVRAYKAAAKAVLMDITSRQEQYVVQNRGYYLSCTAACPASAASLPTGDCAAASTTMFQTLGVTIPQEALDAYNFAICAPATSATNAALASMPTYQATAIPKAATIQSGENPLWVNQFGLRMPLSEW